MGDRRQVHFEDVGIWFYTHWGGASLPSSLSDAIKFAKERWGDHPYCTRVILTKLCEPYLKDVTGAGIWHEYMESEGEDPVVNIEEQTVSYAGISYTFEEYIELKFEDD